MHLPWFLSEIGPAAMLNERRAGVLKLDPASSCLCAGGGSYKKIK